MSTILAFFRCLWFTRFETMDDAYAVMLVARYHGVHTAADSCQFCDGWHIRTR